MMSSPLTAKATTLRGQLTIPGDKSMSHRSLMFSAMCKGVSTVTGLLPSADVLSTLACLEACGVSFECTHQAQGNWRITSPGWPLTEPTTVLDCGNSGTTLRLLTGYLAGQGLYAVLTGDASLRSRPMGRVIAPLTAMGATITGRNGNRNAPVTLHPTAQGALKGLTDYTLPVASAQVKSALLLAALQANAPTSINEPLLCRDHTERMLAQLGIPLSFSPLPSGGRRIEIAPLDPAHKLEPQAWQVAGDPSSAAFWAVAATLTPQASVTLQGISLNPTRTGLFTALQQLGGNLQTQAITPANHAGEPLGHLHVEAAPLAGDLHLGAELIPALVDEIPILMVAALYNDGTLTVTGAEELRAKESDRLAVMATHLQRLGAVLELTHDGFTLTGNPHWQPATHADITLPFATHHDHRIAMAIAILNGVVEARKGNGFKQTWVLDAPECVAVSYPSFFTHWQALGGLV